MSNDSSEYIPPIPDENAPIEWLGFSLAFDFYPPIKVSRKIGLQFAAEIAEILEPEDVQLFGSEWVMTGGGVCEDVNLRISKHSFAIQVDKVSAAIEQYEHKIHTLLTAFEKKFEPKISLH